MRKLLLIFFLLLSVCFQGFAQEAQGGEEDIDVTELIFEHIGDSYGWHILTWGEKEIILPLPCIVIDNGIHVFFSNRMKENGYELNQDGKLVNARTGKRPLDFSITKTVLALLFDSILLVVLILLCARWYKRHDVLKEAPTGLAALLEPVIVMINDEVIKDSIGPDYKRYSPYLLTAFFFILINNLMGIVPFFPGGANVTGNIAITMTLALCTFIATNLFANRHYWKDVFWPEVPVFLKAPLPIMPLIEFIGLFTKPFSLMIRLFANILAGHAMTVGIVCVIFVTAKMGAAINGSMTVITVLFGVFMDCLELLVAFIQAYVFTTLSAVFIGMSRQTPESE